MMTKEVIDYKLAAEQLRTSKPLFGKRRCIGTNVGTDTEYRFGG